VYTEQDRIEATIPIDFFRNLNLFNGDTNGLKGGAFRIRAVGLDGDGNPRRSKESIFFGNGMFSMALVPDKVFTSLQDLRIFGYRYVLTKTPQVSSNTFYWDVISPKGDTTVYFFSENKAPTLKVSETKPRVGVLILAMVDVEFGQYIYIE
jgi:hypothetical protein